MAEIANNGSEELQSCFERINALSSSLSEQASIAPAGVIAAMESLSGKNPDLAKISDSLKGISVEETQEILSQKLSEFNNKLTVDCVARLK